MTLHYSIHLGAFCDYCDQKCFILQQSFFKIYDATCAVFLGFLLDNLHKFSKLQAHDYSFKLLPVKTCVVTVYNSGTHVQLI